MKPFINSPRTVHSGVVSVTIANVGGYQATGQNIDGDPNNDPFIRITGVEGCKHATITLIWLESKTNSFVEFPFEFLVFSSTKSNSFMVSKGDQVVPLAKLKFSKNYGPIKDHLEQILSVRISNENILSCPYKKGFGFKVVIEGLEPFLFPDFFSLGQCKETFKLRLNQQKRGGGKRNPAKKRAYYSDDEEEEEFEDVKPPAPKKLYLAEERIKYLEEVVVTLQGRILELEQQVEMKNSSPKCDKGLSVEPEIKLENGFVLVSLDSSVDLSQLDASSPIQAFDFLRQHDSI